MAKGPDHGGDHATGSHDGATPTTMGAHGASGHHHNDSKITYAELAPKTKAEVDVVIKWASKYKTAADAIKDGWRKATRSLYGIGAHYLKGGVLGFTSAAAEPNLAEPNVLLFDGEGPDAKLAGVSYIMSNPVNPEGFTGKDDTWHRHDAVCFIMKEMLVVSEGSAEGSPINLDDATCKARGGIMFPINNLTMMHLWIGDGYMGHYALFSHDHPLLLNGYQPQKGL